MSAVYLTDITRNLISAWRKDPAPNFFALGWFPLEKVSDLPEFGSLDGGVQRWRVFDREADPSLEGRLVEPVFFYHYDEGTGMMEAGLSRREVRE